MIDFFDDLSDLGVPQTKQSSTKRVDPKAKFIEMAGLNVEQLNAGESKTHWLTVQSDGTVVVTLRNGIRLLNAKKPQFVCKDRDSAVKYLLAASAAAEAGKFDEIFRLQTNRL